METLTSNLTGKVRKETTDREWLIAPVTLVVPGVLNGSKGPLLYTEEDLVASADSWNGMPLVLDHPKANGRHVSARSPDIIRQYGLGNVYNVHVSNGKLVGEAWFDVANTQRINHQIIDSLNSGQSIELSTGLFTQDEPEEGVTNDGKSYTAIARHHRPDHLAILPNGVGACSVNDGCGVNVNQATEDIKASFRKAFWNWLSSPKNTAPITNQESTTMALSKERKKELVDSLITNCACKEDERETLNKLDDDALVDRALKLNDEIVKRNKAATQPIKVGAGELTWNSESMAWNASTLPKEVVGGVEDEEDEDEMEMKDKKKPPFPPTGNKKPTIDEWMKSAPAEVRNAFKHSTAILNREKQQIVDRLTANTPEEKVESVRKLLLNKPIEELQLLLDLNPPTDNDSFSDNPFERSSSGNVPSYFGAAAPVANSNDYDLKNNSPIPVLSLDDFDDKGNYVKGKTA